MYKLIWKLLGSLGLTIEVVVLLWFYTNMFVGNIISFEGLIPIFWFTFLAGLQVYLYGRKNKAWIILMAVFLLSAGIFFYWILVNFELTA